MKTTIIFKNLYYTLAFLSIFLNAPISFAKPPGYYAKKYKVEITGSPQFSFDNFLAGVEQENVDGNHGESGNILIYDEGIGVTRYSQNHCSFELYSIRREAEFMQALANLLARHGAKYYTVDIETNPLTHALQRRGY